jgi:dTDP-4-amino-4,6-dideoxygalactose transaminase
VKPILVTKSTLPPLEEYSAYLERIWASGWLTNHGELVRELEEKLESYLGVPHLQYVSNGTIALQIALKLFGVGKEVITTPYSYVATTTALLWEGCKPVFVDIESETFCIDAGKIEAAITEDTEAILATHVYGYPCEVDKIAAVAKRHGLKVIYDAAHAFGTRLGGGSVLRYGDASTLSFHATKLFHTVEGGAVVVGDAELSDKVWLLKAFGHKGDDYSTVGINGKNSEFHAAMGLCNLPRVESFIRRRRVLSEQYDALLAGLELELPARPEDLDYELDYNYAYYPVVFPSEATMLRVKAALEAQEIYPRRYFYPSLNRLPYRRGEACPVSEDIARRVLCLPLYDELAEDEVGRISRLIGEAI